MSEKAATGTTALITGTRALVSGATGFLGGHLAQVLHGLGYRVRILVHKRHRVEHLLALGMEIVEGDLLDTASLVRATAGQSVVFHTAGKVTDWGPRAEYFQVNAEGTRNVIAACRRERRRAPGARQFALGARAAAHRGGDHRGDAVPALAARLVQPEQEGRGAAGARGERGGRPRDHRRAPRGHLGARRHHDRAAPGRAAAPPADDPDRRRPQPPRPLPHREPGPRARPRRASRPGRRGRSTT